jgi:hypothetical protein
MKIWYHKSSRIHGRPSCRRVRAKLVEYLEGQLPIAEQEMMTNHLNRCRRCAAERTTLKNTLMVLNNRVLCEPEETFWLDLRYRVRQGIREGKSASAHRPSVTAKIWVPAVVIASVLVFLFLWWAGHPRPPVPGSGPMLSRLELEGPRSLRELGQMQEEVVGHLSAGSPGDSLADLLVAVPRPTETIERALLSGKMAEDPSLWQFIIEEEMFLETPLEELIEDLTEDQLRILSARLGRLMG